jgi:hypothetical protein
MARSRFSLRVFFISRSYQLAFSAIVIRRQLRHQVQKLVRDIDADEVLLGKVGIAVGVEEDRLAGPNGDNFLRLWLIHVSLPPVVAHFFCSAHPQGLSGRKPSTIQCGGAALAVPAGANAQGVSRPLDGVAEADLFVSHKTWKAELL